MQPDRTPSAAMPPPSSSASIPPHAFDGTVNQWCNYRGPFGQKCGKREDDPIHGESDG